MNGQFEGHGKYFFADIQKTYEGEFRNSNMEGKGVEVWGDGKRYVGDFKNGIKDGEGTYEWPNGKKYIGSWKNNKQHGNGVMVDMETRQKRQGEWKEGKRLKWLSTNEFHQNSSPVRKEVSKV